MRRINKNKTSYSNFTNNNRHNLFGVNYYDELNEEYSEEIAVKNSRDRNTTQDHVNQINRIHKAKSKTKKEE